MIEECDTDNEGSLPDSTKYPTSFTVSKTSKNSHHIKEKETCYTHRWNVVTKDKYNETRGVCKISQGGPNFKISGISDIHAAKRHVASSEAASLC